MSLKNLLLPERTVTFDMPGMPQFTIDLTYLSRDEMQKLIKKSTKTKYDSRTRAPVETLDEEAFAEEYAKRCIKGWKGFKYKYAKEFILLDDKADDEEEIEFNEEDAVLLLQKSAPFERWITEMTGDLENFTKPSLKKKLKD